MDIFIGSVKPQESHYKAKLDGGHSVTVQIRSQKGRNCLQSSKVENGVQRQVLKIQHHRWRYLKPKCQQIN